MWYSCRYTGRDKPPKERREQQGSGRSRSREVSRVDGQKLQRY
jgi:hypothetical protein